MKMKPFDLAAVKKGHKVCTREGLPVRIICFDAKNETFPIVALIDTIDGEQPESYTIEGKVYDSYNSNDKNDLFLDVKKNEAWMNLYRRNNKLETGLLYSTEKEAKRGADEDSIATVKIEWEE